MRYKTHLCDPYDAPQGFSPPPRSHFRILLAKSRRFRYTITSLNPKPHVMHIWVEHLTTNIYQNNRTSTQEPNRHHMHSSLKCALSSIFGEHTSIRQYHYLVLSIQLPKKTTVYGERNATYFLNIRYMNNGLQLGKWAQLFESRQIPYFSEM